MRKLLFALAAVLTISCSSNDGDEGVTPPENDLANKESLTREEAAQYAEEITKEWKASVKDKWKEQFDVKALKMGGKTMRLWWKIYGSLPADGRSLYISLHGGGGTTAETNDSQWENQKNLYKPEEGIYLCPRAITNTWDLHFVPQADAFYETIIQYFISAYSVSPNKIYLMGYSAGGDGVWRLAPRMADHWAAASMMAGHPGDVSLVNLRNTPFMIWCGANDAAYNRNVECANRIAEMDALQEADPEGYEHEGHIVPGKGHWMDLEDAAAVPWMAAHVRNPFPNRVVWRQEEVLKENFYWLGAPKNELARGKEVIATVKDNTIVLEKCDYSSLTLYLSDQLLNLDLPVKVTLGEKVLFEGAVTRTPENLRNTLQLRYDPTWAVPVVLEVKL